MGRFTPDMQHVEYDALVEAFGLALDALVKDGTYTEEEAQDVAQYSHNREPESVVFTQDHLDEAYRDYEEAMDTVRAVGERDLQTKIDYWRRELQTLEEVAEEVRQCS